MVDDKVYFSVQAWMVTKLGLKGCERDVFAIIYGYCQDRESDYHGSLGYMAELTGYSKNSICTALKNLTEKELILKTEREMNNIKFVRYTINFDGIQVTCTPIQVTCINNKQDNKQDNKKNNSKELLQNSPTFEFGKQKPKRKSLFTECTFMIDDFIMKHNCGNPVRNKLIEYLRYRISVTEKPLYINMWKGMLNKLDKLHQEGYGYEPIIDYCIERGYLSFYPPANCYTETTNKPWEAGVNSVAYTDEELAELRRIDAEREAKGLRTKF
jgi:hypothetical protein